MYSKVSHKEPPIYKIPLEQRVSGCRKVNTSSIASLPLCVTHHIPLARFTSSIHISAPTRDLILLPYSYPDHLVPLATSFFRSFVNSPQTAWIRTAVAGSDPPVEAESSR